MPTVSLVSSGFNVQETLGSASALYSQEICVYCVIQWCTVPYSVALCHTALFYVIQRYVIQCCTMLRSAVLWHTLLCCHALLCYVIQYCVISYNVGLCHTVLCYVVQCCAVSYSAMTCFFVLHHVLACSAMFRHVLPCCRISYTIVHFCRAFGSVEQHLCIQMVSMIFCGLINFVHSNPILFQEHIPVLFNLITAVFYSATEL